MKVKLLKRLRKKGRSQINIYSITKSDDYIIGMKIGYDSDSYKQLFELGDDKEDVLKKAEKIYITEYLKKHERKNKSSKSRRILC
jgi:hypothetical protein